MYFGNAISHKILFSCIKTSSFFVSIYRYITNCKMIHKINKKNIVTQCIFCFVYHFFIFFVTCYNLVVVFSIYIYLFKVHVQSFISYLNPMAGIIPSTLVYHPFCWDNWDLLLLFILDGYIQSVPMVAHERL